VTTAGATSGPQTFTINLPAPGSQIFLFTATPGTFTVPAGVVSILIEATGAGGGKGSGMGTLDPRGMGGRTTATVSVVPGALLTVRVGGIGSDGEQPIPTPGGFNGGGGSTGFGGGGGGGTPGAGSGGGGSSFTAPGVTGVVHAQGVKASNGLVTISWVVP
jgi:hypothetical protein